jgi:predicted Ser/Thr protein kinase
MGEAMQPTALDAPNAPGTIPTIDEVASAFPDYEVHSMIGRGGMGAVFRARQKSLDRDVALKILPPELAARDTSFAERFEAEAKALATMSHPNIVTVHDFGKAGDLHFLSMEFVDGVNLRQLLGSGQLSPEEALEIVPPLCDALQYAHDRGVVHCDIKPENLLLAKDGRIKIADFGIARLIGSENAAPAAGTPAYMAPEQRPGAKAKVDRRADIYALGAVLYEMLTGERPGENLTPPSEKIGVDVRIDEIVLRALRQDPELRFQTAAELRTQLETVAPLATPSTRSPVAASLRPNLVEPRSTKAAGWALGMTLLSFFGLLTFFILMFTVSGGRVAEQEEIAMDAALHSLRDDLETRYDAAVAAGDQIQIQSIEAEIADVESKLIPLRSGDSEAGLSPMFVIGGCVLFIVGFGGFGGSLGWRHLARERQFGPPFFGAGSAGFSALFWPLLVGGSLAFALTLWPLNKGHTADFGLVLGIVATIGFAIWAIRCTALWLRGDPAGSTHQRFAGFVLLVATLAVVIPPLYEQSDARDQSSDQWFQRTSALQSDLAAANGRLFNVESHREALEVTGANASTTEEVKALSQQRIETGKSIVDARNEVMRIESQLTILREKQRHRDRGWPEAIPFLLLGVLLGIPGIYLLLRTR